MNVTFPSFPNKIYDILYIDPPWDYNTKCFRKNKTEFAATDHYNTVKLKDLKELPINDIAAKDSLLYLWVTGPKMNEAIELIKSWGFTYSTVAFVWEKVYHNPGNYTMPSCEFCLVAKKGKIPQPRGAKNIKQFYMESRTIHSKKPDEFRKRIILMHPEQSKIELFARRSSDANWDVWGDEAYS